MFMFCTFFHNNNFKNEVKADAYIPWSSCINLNTQWTPVFLAQIKEHLVQMMHLISFPDFIVNIGTFYFLQVGTG